MPLLQQAFVIVLLSLAIAAMPVQTPDAGSACTEGTIKTNPHLLNCRNETPSIPVTERNEVLTWLICDALALRKKAQGVCRQLSNCSMTKLAECRFQYSSRENQSLSKVVLHFIDFASMGRGVVELARNVCKDEEAKFIRGHLNEYDQCKNILYLAENITNNGLTNTLLSYRCGCPNARVPDGRECPYNPKHQAEIPQDVSSDVRGLAKWASRLADRVAVDMWTSNEIRRKVDFVVTQRNAMFGPSFCQQ